MGFLKQSTMEKPHEKTENHEFYTYSTAYFEFLRHKGKTDYEFEDEYYFTMPAISSR